jgi:putative SOS response-associated peptidase YedK
MAPGSVPIAGSVDRNHMINASAETITEKPSYRPAGWEYVYLIPADDFYEWCREGNRKVPVCFHLRGNSRSPLQVCNTGTHSLRQYIAALGEANLDFTSSVREQNQQLPY